MPKKPAKPKPVRKPKPKAPVIADEQSRGPWTVDDDDMANDADEDEDIGTVET